ncbi:hypothetical protein Bmyc01_60750 [Bacillus mycoides]|uniref:hypothetical protein n=1 Tax=Bacillus TaxID=1386 RepID=UPI001C31C75C|nr:MULTISPECIES: hypothetical protein [Bacillus]MED1512874.1 hypothetical protein [Bacillus proteolyticus]GLV67406.1 hypothetical protein Bmyc01_60750 [Bacillus mycoides]
MDMEEYNLVNRNNYIKPNYKIDDKEVSFDIYVSPDKEVCILGRLDNNYICWASITHLDVSELNVAIFDYILNRKPVMISNGYNVLGFRYEEVIKWHKFRISKTLYRDGRYRYYSQASLSYLGDDEKSLSKYMSGEINNFYYSELAKCNYRLIDNNYIKILECYKNLLTQEENYEYYYEMKPLISILESEGYLKLCPNKEIRNIYWDCMKECSNLYNRYMSSVR